MISPTEHVDTLKIPAIITVPAYFGEKQRNETRIAGLVAGFDVAGIINEPTAAALTYGLKLSDARKIIVFDLGGGTFDVTILEIDGGEAKVIASDGADQLGGKNWDEMIQEHLLSEFYRITDTLVPNDLKWEVQRKATKAKFDLTDEALTEVSINAAGESVDLVLHREAPEGNDEIVIGDEDENAFYFKQRSENLLGICKTILHNTLERAGMEWADIDEILLAGGSSNMPMIPEMLEKISRKKIQRRIQGFSYDTAIAQGAALFGRNKSRVIDVCSKAIGIELKENSRAIIEHLIKKNSPLPISISETFPADTNAVLKVYEGDSTDPDFCTLLGRLELGNPMGKVTVTLTIDFNGIIHASVENNGTKASLKIKSDTVDVDISELKAKIDAIDIKL
ncbi:MAG: Hsp70 family protein [Bacteroidetes bacterium]|nr:MAG: Hsp70 family protein [Bacteroidota bacterium]